MSLSVVALFDCSGPGLDAKSNGTTIKKAL